MIIRVQILCENNNYNNINIEHDAFVFKKILSTTAFKSNKHYVKRVVFLKNNLTMSYLLYNYGY